MLDIFDQYIPLGSTVSDHLRRARTDLQSLTSAFEPHPEKSGQLTRLELPPKKNRGSVHGLLAAGDVE